MTRQSFQYGTEDQSRKIAQSQHRYQTDCEQNANEEDGSEEFPTKKRCFSDSQIDPRMPMQESRSRTSPPSSRMPGQSFERGVCLVPRRIEIAAIKRDQRARGFEDRVRLIRQRLTASVRKSGREPANRF